MTKHSFGPYSNTSKGKGHPIMFGFKEAEHFGDFPDGGGYPKRFLEHAYQTLNVYDPQAVLHLCSGSMKSGIRVDVRHEMLPTVQADVTCLPFRDECMAAVMSDPPYSPEYASTLYGTEKWYPTPGRILKEACRVLVSGGRVGLLHFQVPMSHKPLRLVGVWGITTGAGYAIRAWSVFEKD